MASTHTLCPRVKVVLPTYQVCLTLLHCSTQDISYSICFSQTFSKRSHKKQSENTGRYDFGLFFSCLKCKKAYKRDIKPISRENAHTFEILFLWSTGDWKTEILEYIDEDNLPEYYGGKCQDPNGDPLCRSMVHIFIFTSILKDIYLVIVFLSNKIHVTYFKKINKNC